METNQTPTDPDALLSLVQRIKENYQEPPPAPPKRGKKRDFSALSFLLLAAVAVTLRTFSNSELRKLLEKDERLRQAMEFNRVPHRTQIGRRLAGLVPEAEQQIALLGQRVAEEIKPEPDQPEVSAIDGRMYKAKGPKWHKSDRQKDLVPVGLRNVDTDVLASVWLYQICFLANYREGKPLACIKDHLDCARSKRIENAARPRLKIP